MRMSLPAPEKLRSRSGGSKKKRPQRLGGDPWAWGEVGLGVGGWGLGVWGLEFGFEVWGLGFGVWVSGLGFGGGGSLFSFGLGGWGGLGRWVVELGGDRGWGGLSSLAFGSVALLPSELCVPPQRQKDEEKEAGSKMVYQKPMFKGRTIPTSI